MELSTQASMSQLQAAKDEQALGLNYVLNFLSFLG